MQDRIDWALLEAVAEATTDCSIVLAGEIPPRSPALHLAARFPHLELRGVVPYEEARELMVSLDVAIVPHLLNEQTDRMDPLKIYNFVAAGTPVVTTAPTASPLPEDAVTVAPNQADFVSALLGRLADGRRLEGSLPTELAWSSRVTAMFEAIAGVEKLSRLKAK